MTAIVCNGHWSPSVEKAAPFSTLRSPIAPLPPGEGWGEGGQTSEISCWASLCSAPTYESVNPRHTAH